MHVHVWAVQPQITHAPLRPFILLVKRNLTYKLFLMQAPDLQALLQLLLPLVLLPLWLLRCRAPLS
jgi:hypothetical protein